MPARPRRHWRHQLSPAHRPGATFNPELVESLYAMTAEKTRARGAHQALTPVVDVARDPRWGRVEETFGEDPYLVVTHGHRRGARLSGRRHVQGQKARHRHAETFRRPRPARIRHELRAGECFERVLRETFFLRPFKEAIQKAGAISVMASYNEIDGVPSHANRWLLRDVLRKEWGFKGFVVSDYYAIWELSHRPDTHGHAWPPDKGGLPLAVEAGVNIEFPEPDCYLHLVELVRKKS
jgi:beta-glucosidase